MGKDMLSMYRFSWLIVIAKYFGFRSVEFSKRKSSPIKARPSKALSNEDLFKYVVGYHAARLYGTFAYVSPFILVLWMYTIPQIRDLLKYHKQYVFKKEGVRRSSYSLLSEAVSEVLMIVRDHHQEVNNIARTLYSEESSDLKIMLNTPVGAEEF